MPLACGHFFHAECIKTLRATAGQMKPLCPLCRLELHAPPDELQQRACDLEKQATRLTDAPTLMLKFLERAEAFLLLALREEPGHAMAAAKLRRAEEKMVSAALAGASQPAIR